MELPSQHSSSSKDFNMVKEEKTNGATDQDSEYLALMERIRERKFCRAKRLIRSQIVRPTLMWEKWEEDNDKWLAEHYPNDFDIDNPNELVCETAEPPSSMTVPLFRYQKEWLFWSLKQEESSTKEGNLADEMGMGKTIQAIALVLAKRELGKPITESSLLSSSISTTQELPAVKGTLIICPVVAAIRWVNEFNRCTIEGINKILVYILVYHGNKRKHIHNIEEFDFVIGTYSTVEADRKNVMPPKWKCHWCGKSYFEEKLSIHQKKCRPDSV